MSKSVKTVIAFLDREILAIGPARDPRAEPWLERMALEPVTEGSDPNRPDVPAKALPHLLKKHGADAVVIALKTADILPSILRIPPAEPAEMRSIVDLKMTRIAPFAGEEIAGGHEVLRQEDAQATVLGAAVPVKTLTPLLQNLDAAGLKIERTDLLCMGLWHQLRAEKSLAVSGRSLVLARLDDGWDLLICDDGVPALIRHLPDIRTGSDLERELSITLPRLEMETFSGEITQTRIVAPQEFDTTRIGNAIENATGIPPARHETADPAAMALRGILRRTEEGASLDLTPDSWRRRQSGKRSRRRLVTGVSAGISLWILLNAALFLGPGLVTARLEAVQRQSEAIAPAYEQVTDVRNRIRMIQRYTDRSDSLLACLREITVLLPEGITLTQFTYRRDEDVTVSGEAYAPSLVYAFKEQVEESPIFSGSKLTGPRLDQKRQRHLFELQILFRNQEP